MGRKGRQIDGRVREREELQEKTDAWDRMLGRKGKREGKVESCRNGNKTG